MTKKTSRPARRLALLALSCAALSAGHSAPETPPPAAPVRVLTFNILASQPSWEKNAKCELWAVRRPIVLEVMRDRSGGAPYDFIGTQETSVHPDAALHQVNQLAADLPEYDSLYAACSGEKNGKTHKEFSLSNMIFWRKDRWKIDRADRGTFWLSDTPETPGSNQWAPAGKGGKRNVTYGLFHEIAGGRRTGRKVYFFNTHLNVHVPDARARSAFLIMERIQRRWTQSAPVILTGDFNSRRDSIVYKYLTGNIIDFDNERRTPPQALAEAFAAANPDTAKKPGIDFIFSTAGLRARSATVIDKRRDGARASDHNAVDALLEWQ
ncbi:MAG: endonuclease/exonuclease/phosphatase family protein [Opitutaceae bacterium]|jgi:endonuclease/exonuclease/phosphatase family metal-dependent hydrolase|nr:endonuclease/exonuclease/phosphatase family protein [Opitutaceae bacterium]